MEKDRREAHMNELLSGVTERGPQQLHAGNNHQENVPAVGKEREEVVKDGGQTTWWVTIANAACAFTMRCALYRHEKPRWVGWALSLSTFVRGAKRSLRVWVPFLTSHGAGQSEDWNSVPRDSKHRPSAMRRNFFLPHNIHGPPSFGKDTELPWSLSEGLLR